MAARGRGAVSVLTLGCGRNEVDSDQVAGALQAAGFTLVDDPEAADCVLVNTCTFIAPAREESVEEILAACDAQSRHVREDGTVPVVVVGCMAERHGKELASALPEVARVVGFADYPRLPQIVESVVGADRAANRRLPIIRANPGPQAPPTAGFPVRTVPRGPWAYLKIASGCDRTCTFCTIPSYRGRFVSRPVGELAAEAAWLVGQGVRELVCVSENTTSWGKDLPVGRDGQPGLIEAFEHVDGLERVRLLYLQPAEITPRLLDAMAASPVVAGYYDLSLQHASPDIVRRMARSGGAERFLQLIAQIRDRDPLAVFRSSFIVGFPGETERDVEILADFIAEARLDWPGFFPFSAEEGTPSAVMPDQVDPDEARARRDHLLGLAETVAEEQAVTFVGRRLDVLVDSCDGDGAVGRSYREAPETDGEVQLEGCSVPVGRMVPVEVTASSGVDLVAAVVSA